MRTCARFVCVLILLAPPAAAQSTTDNGIRAVLRGDYQAAVRILRPLADDPARPDPVAQFFLAILYHTGQGVRRDEGRACRLFLRAGTRSHPFSEQSAAIAASMQQQLGDGASLLCALEERWQGGPAQSFNLGPDRQVIFADTSITVTHLDEEHRGLIGLPSGAIFLPILHTPLAVTRPIAARRDFFQWFLWTPDRVSNPTAWTLSWMLSEVAGTNWIHITGENLLVANGPTPPVYPDAASLVRLRVNASGEAELTITGGTAPRTQLIAWHGSR